MVAEPGHLVLTRRPDRFELGGLLGEGRIGLCREKLVYFCSIYPVEEVPSA